MDCFPLISCYDWLVAPRTSGDLLVFAKHLLGAAKKVTRLSLPPRRNLLNQRREAAALPSSAS
jgi:hypothetical protein